MFAGALAGILFAASPASATVAVTPPAVAPLNSGNCTNGEMSQALQIFGDLNSYTFAPGGQFDSSAGWQLAKGAKIVSTTQPDGTTGGVLELPGGSQATSPPMCITQDYPMARLWSRQTSGNESVSFNVQYYDKFTGQWTTPRDNGDFAGPYYWDQGFDWSSYTDWATAWAAYAASAQGQWLKVAGYVTGVKAGWRLSPEMAITPAVGDPGWQQVRFTFYGNGSSKNRSQIDSFLVDPRASR
jgi:hypothetical protein